MWKFLVQLLHSCSQVSTHLMVFYVPTFLGKQKTWRNLNKSTGASQHLCELFTVFVLRRSTRASWRGWGTAWSGGASSWCLPLLWTWTWLWIMQSEDLGGAMLQKGAKRNSTPGQHQKSSFPAQYTSFVVKFSCRLLAPLLQQSEWPAQWANFPAEACTIAFPGSQKLWDNLVDIFAGPGNQLPGILTPKWEFSVLQNSTHTTVFNSQPSTSHSKQWKFFLRPPFSGEENGIG